jgi:hypothetical protein
LNFFENFNINIFLPRIIIVDLILILIARRVLSLALQFRRCWWSLFPDSNVELQFLQCFPALSAWYPPTSDNSGSKNPSSSGLKAILELSWCEKEFDSEGDGGTSIAHPIPNWLNAVIMLKLNISASCRISFFLVWLLVGRENLEDDEIEDDDEDDIGIVNCGKKIFNYADRCAVSVYFANLIMDKAAIEIANTY